jgi:hypothetical protein
MMLETLKAEDGGVKRFIEIPFLRLPARFGMLSTIRGEISNDDETQVRLCGMGLDVGRNGEWSWPCSCG